MINHISYAHEIKLLNHTSYAHKIK